MVSKVTMVLPTSHTNVRVPFFMWSLCAWLGLGSFGLIGTVAVMFSIKGSGSLRLMGCTSALQQAVTRDTVN